MNAFFLRFYTWWAVLVAAGLMSLASSAIVLAQSAEYVVFETTANVGNIEPGKVLKEGDLINLPEGVEIKLLSKTGEILALKGPLEAVVTNEGETSKSALNGSNALLAISDLVFKDKTLVNTLGAARSLSGENEKAPEPGDDPWNPVLAKPGSYCLLKKAPQFARTDSDKPAKILLISSSGKNNQIVWEANAEVLSIKEFVEPDGDQFTMLFSDNVNEFNLHLLDEAGMSVTEQIGWMAEKGCAAQAVKLFAFEAQQAAKAN